MFSVEEKRLIAEAVEKVLLSLDHPEMPKTQPIFSLHVEGAQSWSWADIRPNWMVPTPAADSWNEHAREEMAKGAGNLSDAADVEAAP